MTISTLLAAIIAAPESKDELFAAFVQPEFLADVLADLDNRQAEYLAHAIPTATKGTGWAVFATRQGV
jgi:hypothetical protein